MKIKSLHILILSFIISFLFLYFDPLGLFDYVLKFTGMKLSNNSIFVLVLSFFITWIVHKIFKKKYDEFE